MNISTSSALTQVWTESNHPIRKISHIRHDRPNRVGEDDNNFHLDKINWTQMWLISNSCWVAEPGLIWISRSSRSHSTVSSRGMAKTLIIGCVNSPVIAGGITNEQLFVTDPVVQNWQGLMRADYPHRRQSSAIFVAAQFWPAEVVIRSPLRFRPNGKQSPSLLGSVPLSQPNNNMFCIPLWSSHAAAQYLPKFAM